MIGGHQPHPFLQQGAIGQIGQGIVSRLVAQPILQFGDLLDSHRYGGGQIALLLCEGALLQCLGVAVDRMTGDERPSSGHQ